MPIALEFRKLSGDDYFQSLCVLSCLFVGWFVTMIPQRLLNPCLWNSDGGWILDQSRSYKVTVWNWIGSQTSRNIFSLPLTFLRRVFSDTFLNFSENNGLTVSGDWHAHCTVGPRWRYVLYSVPLELLLLLLLLLYTTIILKRTVCAFLFHSTAGDMTDRERARDGGWRAAKGCRLESKLVRYKGLCMIMKLRNRTHSMIWTFCSYQCYSIRKTKNQQL